MRPAKLLFCLLAFLLLAGCDSRQEYAGRIILGGSRSLSGRIDGELIILGGNTVLDLEGYVTGSLYMFGGDIEVEGRIEGDISYLGGSLTLGASARVDGDVDAAAQGLVQLPGARVKGDINTGVGLGLPQYERASDPTLAERIVMMFMQALGFALVAGLGARFTRRPLTGVMVAVRDHAVITSAMGILAGLVALVLIVLMVYTIILIPVAIILGIFVLLIIAYGWIAVGMFVGQTLVLRLPWSWSVPVQTSLGGFTLILLLGLVNLIPFLRGLGDIAVLLLSTASFGAILLTRIGMRRFVPAAYPGDASYNRDC